LRLEGDFFLFYGKTQETERKQATNHTSESSSALKPFLTSIALTIMAENRVPWEESNLAGIGSDLDKKIREAAAENEVQWGDVGQEACLKVWRIEQFKVAEWPDTKYGRFHEGDSYIVLHSYVEGEDDPKLLHDLHIWIGSKSSQDEYGTAAYKMVECDDLIGGIAVQHREVQGCESDMFKEYFGGRLLYLSGGVESGFRHVEETVDEPQLYRVKGTEKAMSLTELPVECSSLNSGDSFILVCDKEKVFVWNGQNSSPEERMRANTLAEGMATECTAVVLDQGANDDSAEEFWAVLAGDAADICQGDDTSDEEVSEFTPKLYRLGGGAPEVVAEGEPIKIGWTSASPKIDKALLDEADTFLLDSGWEIFVWMGKNSDRSERLGAMNYIDTYGQHEARAKHVPSTILKSGYESFKFQSFFYEQ